MIFSQPILSNLFSYHKNPLSPTKSIPFIIINPTDYPSFSLNLPQYFSMGQQPPTSPSLTPPSFQQLEQHVDTLFNPVEEKTNLQSLKHTLQAVLDYLRLKLPAEMHHDKMYINLLMLKVLYQPNFASTILKLLHLFVQQLHQLNKRNFLLVKRQELIFLLNLARFILYFTDQKMAFTMHSLTFKKDLTQETLTYIQNLEKKDLKFNPHKNFLDKLTPAQAEQVHEILQNILIKLIKSRNNILARSSFTYEVISLIQPCLFMLLVKLIKTPFHTKNFSTKIRKGSPLKYHLRIGQYFLGQGCDNCRSSVYEPAVLLLVILIERNSKNLLQIESEIGTAASHLFKNIPIPLKNTFYHFLAITCLYGLTFVKDGSEYFVRFSFNRIPSLILLGSLISQKKVTSPQMTEFLQKLCLHTRIGSIERGFMTSVIEKYYKLVKQKIKEKNRMQQSKMETSRLAYKFLQKVRKSKPLQKASPLLSAFSTESNPSQILQKYLLSGTEPYSIKFESRRYLITPQMLVVQFERNEEYAQNQLKALSERFTYQSLLSRRVLYQYIESVEWNAVLPRIIKTHNIFGEQITDHETKGVGRGQRVVGSTPVIRQRYVGSLSEIKSEKSNGESSMKGCKNKHKLPYLYTEAAQVIYQQTSEDQRAEDFKLEIRASKIKMVREQIGDQTGHKDPHAQNVISLVFEEQEQGKMEDLDDQFQTSELELKQHRRDKQAEGEGPTAEVEQVERKTIE